jgi:hypothetical protein
MMKRSSETQYIVTSVLIAVLSAWRLSMKSFERQKGILYHVILDCEIYSKLLIEKRRTSSGAGSKSTTSFEKLEIVIFAFSQKLFCRVALSLCKYPWAALTLIWNMAYILVRPARRITASSETIILLLRSHFDNLTSTWCLLNQCFIRSIELC